VDVRKNKTNPTKSSKTIKGSETINLEAGSTTNNQVKSKVAKPDNVN
jgi:hypothetical protein